MPRSIHATLSSCLRASIMTSYFPRDFSSLMIMSTSSSAGYANQFCESVHDYPDDVLHSLPKLDYPQVLTLLLKQFSECLVFVQPLAQRHYYVFHIAERSVNSLSVKVHLWFPKYEVTFAFFVQIM